MKKEIRSYVVQLLAEAKKKKNKAEKLKYEARPAAYSYSEAFDFSAPLGAYNLYRSQGAVNWGPMTGPGTKIDDRVSGKRVESETALRSYLGEALHFGTSSDSSPWMFLSEAEKSMPRNVWEAAERWYDHEGLGLGKQTPAGIKEKKIEITKSKNKLAHRKGVKNPGAGK